MWNNLDRLVMIKMTHARQRSLTRVKSNIAIAQDTGIHFKAWIYERRPDCKKAPIK